MNEFDNSKLVYSFWYSIIIFDFENCGCKRKVPPKFFKWHDQESERDEIVVEVYYIIIRFGGDIEEFLRLYTIQSQCRDYLEFDLILSN